MVTGTMWPHLCLGTMFQGFNADFVGAENAFEEDRMRRSILHVDRFHEFDSIFFRSTSLRLVVSFPFVGLPGETEVLERIRLFSTVEFAAGLDFYAQVDGLFDLEIGEFVGISELGHLFDGSFVLVVAHHALNVLCFFSVLALGAWFAFG